MTPYMVRRTSLNSFNEILEEKEREINALKADLISLKKENEALKAKLGVKKIEERLSKIDRIFDINSFYIEEESLRIKALSRYFNRWKVNMEASIEQYKDKFDNNIFEFMDIMHILRFELGEKDNDPGRRRIALCFTLLEGHGIYIKYPEEIRHGRTKVKWFPEIMRYIERYRNSVRFK